MLVGVDGWAGFANNWVKRKSQPECSPPTAVQSLNDKESFTPKPCVTSDDLTQVEPSKAASKVPCPSHSGASTGSNTEQSVPPNSSSSGGEGNNGHASSDQNGNRDGVYVCVNQCRCQYAIVCARMCELIVGLSARRHLHPQPSP